MKNLSLSYTHDLLDGATGGGDDDGRLEEVARVAARGHV